MKLVLFNGPFYYFFVKFGPKAHNLAFRKAIIKRWLFFVMAGFKSASLSLGGGLAIGASEMSLKCEITVGFIIIVVFVVFVVFSLSFIKFISCTVWSMVVLFERQPKPKGPPGFSKEGGGGRFHIFVSWGN